MNEVEAYLREAARLRGMDPDKIVRIAKTEGGVTDPFRQSSVINKRGQRERSYGPLQLYIDGGVGNRAIAAGIDPRKDWRGGIDFGLDYVAKKGSWDEWYGPQNAGLPLDYGIRGAKPIGYKPMGMSLASNPIGNPGGYASEGPMQEAFNRTQAPPLPPPTNVRDYPVAEVAAAPTGGGSLDGLKDLIGKLGGDGKAGKGFSSMLSAMGGGSSGSSAPQIQPSNLGPAVSSEIASKSASAQALMSQIMQARRGKKRPGLSLMG